MKYKVTKEFYNPNDKCFYYPNDRLSFVDECYENFLIHYGFVEEVKEEPEKIGLEWRPKHGEGYWSVNLNGIIDLFCWREDEVDEDLWLSGRVFKTEEEAIAFRDHERLEKKLIRAGIEMGGREKGSNEYGLRVRVTPYNSDVEATLNGLYFNSLNCAGDFLREHRKELQEWASYFLEKEEQ